VCTVVNPGLLSTVQDLGRTGYRAFGMPLAGAMDRYACTMANLLTGNRSDAAVVEMTMRGARLRFSQRAYVAVCGADMQGELNGRKVRNWSAFPVASGDELAFGYAERGCRSYVAFHGGIAVPTVMGSRSTYLRAGLGGFQGRALKAGDVLAVKPAGALPSQPVELPLRLVPEYAADVLLRAMAGPQDDHFSAEGLRTFWNSEYVVTVQNDRMGYRLEGPAMAHGNFAADQGADIVSDALCPGAIQVPGSGMPIIMGADCQSTGGYAKIATVIGADLSKVAQMKAGDRVRFVPCSDAEAVAALVAERQCYRKASGTDDDID